MGRPQIDYRKWRKIRSAVTDMLNFQVGMLSRQVDIQVWYLEERSEPVGDIHLEVVGI